MVIKKKRTYKKQKGGMKEIDRIMIPFFDIINKLICICSIIINTVVITNTNGNKLDENYRIIKELNIFIDKNIKDSLFINMITNINKCIQTIQTIQNIQNIKIIIKNILEIIIESLLSNFSQNLNFFDKFIKIYIHILFIEYLFNPNNHIFKEIFMQLLQNRIFKKELTFSKYFFIIKPNKPDNIAELQQQLRNLFLNDYSREYGGIPVFYGGLLFDSQYNEFVCRQVGASSNKKRNFIINPVLAFAYGLFYKLITKNNNIKEILKIIDRLPKINNSLQELTDKINNYETFNKLIIELFKRNSPYIFALIAFVIQNFNTKRENNMILLRRLHKTINKESEEIMKNNYEYLYSKVHVPKLTHVKTSSQFCIALNQFGEEEIIESSTFSKCAWKYGCNLKMTPIIREENISSMNDMNYILRLAQILLLIVLTYGDNIFMDILNVQDFLVDRYINKLDGRPTNINMNSIRIKLNEYQIQTLVKTLSIRYKDLLINKIKSEYVNTSEIDEKLKMIRDELGKFNNGLKYLYTFLFKKKDIICKNNRTNRINGIKQHKFGNNLYKIQKLII